MQLEDNNLYISKITVDEGPKLKRWQPRARGQAYEIQKKTSHVTIVLDELEKKPKKTKKTKKNKAIRKEIKKTEEEKKIKTEKPRFRPEAKTSRPKIEKGIRKMFRRKSF